MGLGMTLVGTGFFVFVLGILSLNGVVDGSKKMSIWYLIIGFFILTVGELFVSPIGMALFSKLMPKKYAASAMSLWFVTYFFASLAQGPIVGATENLGYSQVFGYMGAIMIFLGVCILAIKNTLEKLMAMDELANEK